MMIEANPDLSPTEIKEILKLTAERRGEPSNPDVDPFWNRDFGFGMVDAYAAVSMAFDLKYQGLTGEVDVLTQVHIMDTNTSDGIATLKGLAWGQVVQFLLLNIVSMVVSGCLQRLMKRQKLLEPLLVSIGLLLLIRLSYWKVIDLLRSVLLTRKAFNH